MNILLSGSSGMLGKVLKERLSEKHTVLILQRRSKKDSYFWDTQTGEITFNENEKIDIVIHLAGEGIATKRWSGSQKSSIRSSRVEGTALLSHALLKLKRKPELFMSASAVGYYGDRGDEWLDEGSTKGKGFLSDVTDEWEKASKSLQAEGVRVARLRFGILLSKDGGALSKMLLPFKLGLGGIVGSGQQYMSWITLDDTVSAIEFIISTKSLDGAVNIVSPSPSTNKVFTQALAKTLNRPAFLPLPAPVAKLLLGEMAKELLLSSTRVRPKKLLDSGFVFKHKDIYEAFNSILL